MISGSLLTETFPGCAGTSGGKTACSVPLKEKEEQA